MASYNFFSVYIQINYTDSIIILVAVDAYMVFYVSISFFDVLVSKFWEVLLNGM